MQWQFTNGFLLSGLILGVGKEAKTLVSHRVSAVKKLKKIYKNLLIILNDLQYSFTALWVMWGLLFGHLVAFKAPKSWPNKVNKKVLKSRD